MTRNGTRALLAAVVVGATLWALMGMAACAAWGASSTPSDAPHAGTTCVEDASCWTWSRMGNRMRGIVSLRGTRVVVGTCRFQRMMMRRTHAQRVIMGYGMKGDAWAMRHGCGIDVLNY